MAGETGSAGGRVFPRLHWGAVIAGVLVAIAAHIVMGLVGAALGFAAAPAGSPAFGTAAAIWALVTPFVATLLGAWLAARMSSAEDSRTANLHGILVWCIGLIAGAVFLAGTVASGAMSAGTAAGRGLGPAQRTMGMDGGALPGMRPGGLRAEEAARRAAEGMSAAALASIAGLLGAVVGAGLSQRRAGGRGMGWRIQRREEQHAGGLPGHDRGYAGTPTYGTTPPRTPGATGGSPEAGRPPTDPYQH